MSTAKKPETRATALCGASSSTKAEELVEALRDPTVAAAIAAALGPYIARAIDAALEAKLAGLRSAVDELATDNAVLKTSLNAMTTESNQLKVLVEEQGRRLEDVEIYSRAHDIIIRGLPEGSHAERASADQNADALTADTHASVESSVIALCTDRLNVTVSYRDIAVAHRLKAGPHDSARPIIVRFTSRKVRDEVLRAKKKLFVPRGSNDGGTKGGVFISEHLTRGVSTLFYEARKLAREKKIFSAWTNKGLVNIKFSADASEKPTIIRSLADLRKPRGGLRIA